MYLVIDMSDSFSHLVFILVDKRKVTNSFANNIIKKNLGSNPPIGKSVSSNQLVTLSFHKFSGTCPLSSGRKQEN